jgi:hypothetical protein
VFTYEDLEGQAALKVSSPNLYQKAWGFPFGKTRMVLIVGLTRFTGPTPPFNLLWRALFKQYLSNIFPSDATLSFKNSF